MLAIKPERAKGGGTYLFPLCKNGIAIGLITQQIRREGYFLRLGGVILEERIRVPYGAISGSTHGRFYGLIEISFLPPVE